MWSALQPQVKLVLKTRGQQEEWGMSIMSFIKDAIDTTQLMYHALGGDEYKGKAVERWGLRRTTQAHFYASGKYEVGSHNWRSALATAVQNGNPSALSYPEYHLAKYELRIAQVT
jgi:hypothetical protein